MKLPATFHPLNHSAPWWAEWFAIDDDGGAYFYQHKPHFYAQGGYWVKVFRGRHKLAGYADFPHPRGRTTMEHANWSHA